MATVTMKQLLEAGVHFGHQSRRWNPKMAPYIYAERNKLHIIDLQKTVAKLEKTCDFVRNIVNKKGKILFVGTKKQASESIKEEATKCDMFYVNARWLGGMMTNFKTIRTRVDRLYKLNKMKEDGTFSLLTKKEANKLEIEIEKLEKFLGGIKKMETLPQALFVVDPKKERIAILEARKLKIPIIAMVDTNCDPDEIDYIIPANDDAIRAVKLIVSVISNTIIEAKQGEIKEEMKNKDDDEKIIEKNENENEKERWI